MKRNIFSVVLFFSLLTMDSICVGEVIYRDNGKEYVDHVSSVVPPRGGAWIETQEEGVQVDFSKNINPQDTVGVLDRHFVAMGYDLSSGEDNVLQYKDSYGNEIHVAIYGKDDGGFVLKLTPVSSEEDTILVGKNTEQKVIRDMYKVYGKIVSLSTPHPDGIDLSSPYRPRTNRYGMGIGKRGDIYIITSVKPGSPADIAGVKKNTILFAIGGFRLDMLNHAEVIDLLQRNNDLRQVKIIILENLKGRTIRKPLTLDLTGVSY